MPEKFYILHHIDTNETEYLTYAEKERNKLRNEIYYLTYTQLEAWISPDKDVFFYDITLSGFDKWEHLPLLLQRLKFRYGLQPITRAALIDYMQSQIDKGAQAGHDFYRYDLTGDPEHPVCVISGSLKDMADWILDDYSVHEIPAADYYAYFKSNP